MVHVRGIDIYNLRFREISHLLTSPYKLLIVVSMCPGDWKDEAYESDGEGGDQFGMDFGGDVDMGAAPQSPSSHTDFVPSQQATANAMAAMLIEKAAKEQAKTVSRSY